MDSDTEAIETRHWTIPRIKSTLGIDDTAYSSLRLSLEKGMKNERLYGGKLSTVTNKQRLLKVIAKITDKHSDIFSSVSFSIAKRCLTVMAQKCNNNQKRRVVKKGTDERAKAQYQPLLVVSKTINLLNSDGASSRDSESCSQTSRALTCM